MARPRNSLGLIALAAVAAAFALPAPASAERPLDLGITGYTDSLFFDPDPAVHDLWLDRTVDAGAEIVVLSAGWRSIAPATPPANPRDPADPGYDWGDLDAGVRTRRPTACG